MVPRDFLNKGILLTGVLIAFITIIALNLAPPQTGTPSTTHGAHTSVSHTMMEPSMSGTSEEFASVGPMDESIDSGCGSYQVEPEFDDIPLASAQTGDQSTVGGQAIPSAYYTDDIQYHPKRPEKNGELAGVDNVGVNRKTGLSK